MEPPIFKREMLTLAREQLGFTQTLLAERLGVAPSLISKFESGIVAPTPENIERLADALDCRTDFFYQTDAIYGLGCSFLYHRKRKTMPVPEQRRLVARLNVLRMQISRLLRGTELEAENKFVPRDVEQHGGPEKIANWLRAAWRLPDGPIASVVHSIESAGGIVIRYPFNNHKASGMSWWLPGLPPLFFVNSDMPGDHQRFTLMHEVAHVIMHRVPSERIEEEADRFAAEFLTPAKEIRQDLLGMKLEKAAGLKSFWKVSMQMIIRRAKDLGCLKPDRYRWLNIQLSAAGYRRAEPLPIEPEEPTLLRQLVELHLNEHGYSPENLAALAQERNVRRFCDVYIPDKSQHIRMAR